MDVREQEAASKPIAAGLLHQKSLGEALGLGEIC
jgi:hypothetical protein